MTTNILDPHDPSCPCGYCAYVAAARKPVIYVRIAELSERAYKGHPSCTTCHVDYLGEGTCGACLFVANLVVDSLIVLDRAVRAEARLAEMGEGEGYEF